MTIAPDTSAHEAAELIATGDVTVLDVRTPAEFATGHIDGAINIPVDEVATHASRIAAAVGRPLLVVCQVGPRAKRAISALDDVGYTDTTLLVGGFNAWQNARLPVRGSAVEKWSLERQVRLVAGSIVLTSVAASALLPRAKWLAAGIGGGLTFAALSDTCPMASALARLPYNRSGADDAASLEQSLAQLRTST